MVAPYCGTNQVPQRASAIKLSSTKGRMLGE